MTPYYKAVLSAFEGVDSFFKKTFTSIEVNGPTLDVEKISRNPLMLVSSHRSHIDYFIVGYVFTRMGFKNLRFAAGDNLTKLPWIGPKFLGFGAFTVKRDNGFDRHYIRNLCYNVVSMLENGDVIIVFPEGGRSYSGAMLEMRTGILGALVLTQANNPDRDAMYIPITVSYEYPPDVPFFSMQYVGKLWRKRSNILPKRLIGNLLYFGADMRAFIPLLMNRYIRSTYGAIYIDYSEPVALKSIVDVKAGRAANARDEFSAHRVSMQKLSEAVFEQLLRLYRVLPLHVVAFFFKKYGKCSITDCAEMFPESIVDLKARNRNVKELEKHTDLENAEVGIRQLIRLRAIKKKKDIFYIRNESLINYFAATVA